MIGYGLVALSVTIYSSETAFWAKVQAQNFEAVGVIGVFGFLTVLFDYLQFVFAAIAINMAMRCPEEQYSFDRRWIAYKMRKYSFRLKQAFAISGVIISVYCVVSALRV